MKKLRSREVKVTSLGDQDSLVEVEKEEIPAHPAEEAEEDKEMVHGTVLEMEARQRENGSAVMAAWAKLVADAQARMKAATQVFSLAQSENLDEVVVLPTKTKSNTTPQKSQNDEVPPMPTPLPPLHTVSRNNLQTWCQRLNISKNGRKHILYKRLMDHVSPSEQDIPTVEEKDQWIKVKTEALLEEDSPGESQAMVRAAEPFTNKKKKREATKTSLVQTASMAAWGRLMATAKAKAVWPASVSSEPARAGQSNSPRWCVVHGESFPNDVSGSVPLEFHAGQTWVPEEDMLIPLLLLPACSFPPPGVEDNWLCPKCVCRNKIMMDSIL
ncbi:developmental pluripotency-associated protein 4 [Monodelphis domestica]|uniref:Developmental pluripotency-associated protein 4 n=1 Tax=Monodelphis domestica TaxID=13616 RepID=F7FTI4_MONDO|nr:developmental pluripotency-associated protein 4 [Monodelphis domestica]